MKNAYKLESRYKRKIEKLKKTFNKKQKKPKWFLEGRTLFFFSLSLSLLS